MNCGIKILRNIHFWIILVVFLVCIILHYPQQLPFLGGSGLSSFLGLSRHSVERIFFLLPIVYGGIAFGLKGGIVCLLISLAAMLPRVIFVSEYVADAWFETAAIIIAGGLANWWIEGRRWATGRREQALLKLESMRRELQSSIQIIKESEKRLSVLRAISTSVNQSLVLDEVANVAVDKIMEVADVDLVLLFTLEEKAGFLELVAYRGISEDFAFGVDRLRLGEGFNGQVAQTGEPLFIEDSALDPRLSREVVKQERLNSQFIVPLKSGDKVVGTLCIGVRRLRQFTADEKELLRLIGIELGIAIQKARLYQESQLSARRFQELFEKAHDAIWVQDLEGKIIAANQACSSLTGYELESLINRDVVQFLTPTALDLAREIRHKLLLGEIVEQPYEQRIITKAGTEAIIKLTTSVLGEGEMPRTFQHIARDITKERQLQDDLSLYISQITRAHEEERSRIARELHDDTIQKLVIIGQRLDIITSGNNAVSGEVLSFVERLRRDIDGIVQEIRNFAQDLRPPTLEYLGLRPALRELASQIRQESGVSVNLKVNGKSQHFTKEEEILIYRIVQEALRNVWKHAEATNVDVAVEFKDGKTFVIISDNGKGFKQQDGVELARTSKLGLIGMYERARLLGGTLEIKSELGKGTQVIAEFPS